MLPEKQYSNLMFNKHDLESFDRANDALLIELHTPPQIQEYEFRERVLPELLKTDGTANMAVWLDYALYNQPLDVMRNGVVAYTVPPLYNTRGLTTTIRNPEHAVSQVMNEVTAQAQRNPMQYDAIVFNSLTERFIPPTYERDYLLMWNTVLKENGIDIKEHGFDIGSAENAAEGGGATTVSSPNTPTSSLEIEGYDEY